MKEIDLKALIQVLLKNFETEIFVGDYTTKAKVINSSLTTSSTDDAWLKAALAAICKDYPNRRNVIFKGRMSPNSQGYFEIYIYDTSLVNSSTGLPQYCHGTWKKWQNILWIISTNSYAFSYVAK